MTQVTGACVAVHAMARKKHECGRDALEGPEIEAQPSGEGVDPMAVLKRSLQEHTAKPKRGARPKTRETHARR